MEISSNLGAIVRRLRRGQSLTQRDLANKLDISVAYINLIENSRRSITVPMLLKIANLFDVELSELTNDYNKQFSMEIEIPSNMKAQICFPKYFINQKIEMNGKIIDHIEKGNFLVVKGIGSGQKKFKIHKSEN